jgi:2-polyprenyl-6-methoxyphenol hydroxylase-like FAD-dependent oxidoreductase
MTKKIQTTCCISGGGPAGLMLGFLLAKTGVDVTVLEKHADFLRDFRGDTVHPSTMQTIEELGLLDDFLKLPHQPVSSFNGQFGNEVVHLADFKTLAVSTPYIAIMPQWDFLNFLADRASAYPNFRLLMRTEANDLIRDGSRVVGVKARGPEGDIEIRSDLVVAADGRWSRLRAAAGLGLEDRGAPIDVLWFRVSRKPEDTDQVQARFDSGRVSIALNRGDYWQCAFVIPKGGDQKIRAAGLAAFHDSLRALYPFGASRADEIQSWDQVKLLSVQVNRLKTWWLPGFLCIGDAAHAMSPVGGVGVNLAVQDAVAAANTLAGPLRDRQTVTDDVLAAVQKRREWPTRATQRMQLFVHDAVLAPALNRGDGKVRIPLVLRLVTKLPILKRMPARILGLGFRPEHIAASLASGWQNSPQREARRLFAA